MSENLTNEQLAEELALLPALEKHIKAIKAMAYSRAVELGQKLPGYKVVEGRAGNRRWVSEEEAIKALVKAGIAEEDAFNKHVISPVGVDDLMKIGLLDEGNYRVIRALIEQPPKSLQVVPSSDKRPEYATGCVADDLPDMDFDISDLV